MRIFFQKNIFIFFWIAAATDIVAIATGTTSGHFVSKPLLLPLLMTAVFMGTPQSKGRMILLAGLLAAFCGDVFLLLDEKRHPLSFIGGLVCFLITHVFYCWYFLQIKKQGISLLKQRPYLVMAAFFYTIALLMLLVPAMKDKNLVFPVIIYACVLTGMLLCCLHAFNNLQVDSRKVFVAGAVFFVISDSLLAIDKFYLPFRYAGCFIMLTYCLAQYFIVKGFIKNSR